MLQEQYPSSPHAQGQAGWCSQGLGSLVCMDNRLPSVKCKSEFKSAAPQPSTGRGSACTRMCRWCSSGLEQAVVDVGAQTQSGERLLGLTRRLLSGVGPEHPPEQGPRPPQRARAACAPLRGGRTGGASGPALCVRGCCQAWGPCAICRHSACQDLVHDPCQRDRDAAHRWKPASLVWLWGVKGRDLDQVQALGEGLDTGTSTPSCGCCVLGVQR